MNKRSRKYIKVYKQHYGDIPKDEYGVSYDIHHIDGDYTNNDPSNLVALSIKEHYELHKKQEDWGAAWAISKRFGITYEEKAEITRQMNIANAKRGTHWSQISSKNGTHPFQDLEFQKYMAQQAKLKGNRSVDRVWTCEVCNNTGKGMSNYSRYHGENCGKSSVSRGRLWINNSSSSKMIYQDELELHITQGWSLGRGSSEITLRRTNSNGTSGRATPYVRKTTRPYKRKQHE